MLYVYSDASIQPFNPDGIGAWAFLVKKSNKIIHKDVDIYGWGHDITNNVMEYVAVVAAMHWLISLDKKDQEPVIFSSDSQLVVNQITQRWDCQDEKLIPHLNLIKRALRFYTKPITFRWIPRDKNKEADELSRSLYTDDALKFYADNYWDLVEQDDLSF